jgi:DNA transformation protein
VGLYYQARMFGLIADDVAYLKVSDMNRDDFEKAGSKPFQPYPHKKTTMSYWEIPGEVLENPDKLARWAAKASAAAKGT